MSATGALLYAFIKPYSRFLNRSSRLSGVSKSGAAMNTGANRLLFAAVAFAAAAVALFVSMLVAGPARAADAATPVAAYVETLE